MKIIEYQFEYDTIKNCQTRISKYSTWEDYKKALQSGETSIPKGAEFHTESERSNDDFNQITGFYINHRWDDRKFWHVAFGIKENE